MYMNVRYIMILGFEIFEHAAESYSSPEELYSSRGHPVFIILWITSFARSVFGCIEAYLRHRTRRKALDQIYNFSRTLFSISTFCQLFSLANLACEEPGRTRRPPEVSLRKTTHEKRHIYIRHNLSHAFD